MLDPIKNEVAVQPLLSPQSFSPPNSEELSVDFRNWKYWVDRVDEKRTDVRNNWREQKSRGY